MKRCRRQLDAALQRLSRQLRSLSSERLPLRVLSVRPLSAAARHMHPMPPLPHPLAGAANLEIERAVETGAARIPRCLEPVELLVQLEGSGGLTLPMPSA